VTNGEEGDNVARGTVQASFNDKGFTFISPEADSGEPADVFLHITRLLSGQDAKLFVRGSRVEFDIALVMRNSEEKPQARNARLLLAAEVPTSVGAISTSGRRGALKFWSPLGFGFLVDQDSGDELYVHTSSVPGGYLRNGDVVQFDIEQSDSGAQAVNVSVLGWAKTGDPFTDLLDLGGPRWAAQLADLAEPENWNYQVKPAKDTHSILRSYIKHTFLRLDELDNYVLTSAEGSHLSFNTGLVTPFQEQLFALFGARQGGKLGPSWVLKGFEKASSVTFLKLFGGSLPPLAWYFDEASQLVYDTSLHLSVNVEHVPHDPERFPDALKLMSPQDLAALVNAKAPEAIDRVRRNYKTAIPQFYRDGKSGAAKMQLLLPVALLRRDNVELALAVDRLPSDVYLGRTVLSLDWAYNNARLLTRPDTDWLRP
jgi:cold shock CspA family protein